MKLNSLFVYFLSFPVLLTLGCKNDNADEIGNEARPDTATTPAPTDTASLNNLLTQYDPPGRVVWQKPELIIQKMGNIRDKVIADIGAGSGFFSRRLAQQAKKVIAVEVDPRFIHFMDSIKLVELSPEFQSRFETRLATPDDSKLKPAEADIILIVNTYIYFQHRVPYLVHLKNAMPDGGKIIIVDFKRKRIPINYPPAKIRLELYEVENELEAAGFKNITSDDCALDYQYVVIAEK